MIATFILACILITSAAMTIGAENFFESDKNSTTVFAKKEKTDGGLFNLIKSCLANASLISHLLPVSIFAALDILHSF